MPHMRSITVKAPAKVNLRLAVGGRREDGYHELANIFLAVSCFDEVTLTPAEELRVTVSGAQVDQIPADESNLAAQAVMLLAKRSGVDPDVHVHIHKRIPVQGGMAGGSADAAGALVGCNALWNLGLSHTDLMSLAAELGSDVPFSVLGGAALGVGRGERLTSLTTGGTSHWVFAMAEFGLSTPEVFAAQERLRRENGLPWAANLMPSPEASDQLIDALARGDAVDLATLLSNDLEPVVTSMRPELARTLETGRNAGALAGMLCGTGATVAFLVSDHRHAQTVAQTLLASGTCASVQIAHGPVPGPQPELTTTTGEKPMAPHVQSREEVFAVLRGIWEEVLEAPVDDPEENFIELGGDSLLALVVADRAEEAGLSMPPTGVLRRPTLRELTDAVLDPHLFEHW